MKLTLDRLWIRARLLNLMEDKLPQCSLTFLRSATSGPVAGFPLFYLTCAIIDVEIANCARAVFADMWGALRALLASTTPCRL